MLTRHFAPGALGELSYAGDDPLFDTLIFFVLPAIAIPAVSEQWSGLDHRPHALGGSARRRQG